MDYRDNFQDMIARYNRELMRAYQKRRREEPAWEEAASVSASVAEPEEAASVSASVAEPGEAAPVSASVAEPEATASMSASAAEPETAASVSSSAAEPEEAAPVSASAAGRGSSEGDCDMDTRPRYPLFTKDERLAPVVSANRETADTAAKVVSAAAMTEESRPAKEKAAPTSATEPLPEPASSPEPAPASEVGYLQIRVTTAKEAVPIEGAHVTVSREENGERVAYFIGMTDRSGKTALFPLPAAAAVLSQSPGAEQPTYTPYNIDVYANGYYRMENLGLPMYGGIKAELPVQLIPLPENGEASDTLTFPDSGPTALSSEGGRMS